MYIEMNLTAITEDSSSENSIIRYNSSTTGGNNSSRSDEEVGATSYHTQLIWTTWGVVGGYLVFLVLYNIFPALMMTYASRSLYNTMFHRVMHATSYFFETTPVGGYLGRLMYTVNACYFALYIFS